MLQPGRNYSSSDYRFGFNGKVKDDEIKGSANSLDFNARIYDSRIGVFLNVDPLTFETPSWSPYHFANGNPIYFIDPDGRSVRPVNKDAEVVLEAFYKNFGVTSVIFKGILRITDHDGIIRSALNSSAIHEAKKMGFNEFNKTISKSFEEVGVQLSKKEMKSIFTLYNALYSTNIYEISVYFRGKDYTYSRGYEGTIWNKEGEPSPSTNENYDYFVRAVDKNPNEINKVINSSEGKFYGIIPYRPIDENQPESNNQGTIIIDATEKTPSKAAIVLDGALQELVPDER